MITFSIQSYWSGDLENEIQSLHMPCLSIAIVFYWWKINDKTNKQAIFVKLMSSNLWRKLEYILFSWNNMINSSIILKYCTYV